MSHALDPDPVPLGLDARTPPLLARPLEPTPGPPPLDPSAPVPDDPGELDDPDLLPPAPIEPAVPGAPAEPEPV